MNQLRGLNAISHVAYERAPVGRQRGLLSVSGWVLSHHHIPARTQNLYAPLSWLPPPLSHAGGGSGSTKVSAGYPQRNKEPGLPEKTLVLIASNHKDSLGSTVVHLLTKEAAL